MKKQILTALTGAALAVLLAGCAPAAPEKAEAGALDALTVASIDVEGSIPLLLGKEKGIFKAHGIELSTTISPAFDGTLANVMNGQAEVGFAASPPMLNAMAQGAPIRAVAQTAAVADETQASVDVIDPAIDRPKALEGRTVGVTSLNHLSAIGIKMAVAKDGGDPAKVKMVELPDAQRTGALLEGRIDAGVFQGIQAVKARAQERVVELFQYTDGLPKGSPMDMYFANDKFVADNADLMVRFRAALTEASDYSNKHPDEVRGLLREMLADIEGSAEAIDALALTNYNTEISPDALMKMQEGLKTYGKLTAIVPADRFFSFENGK